MPLSAGAVKLCEEKQLPYLTYAKMSEGSLGEFKRNNGFEKIEVPRYYIPLTVKGRILLKLHLHKGIIVILPRPVLEILRTIRKWTELIQIRMGYGKHISR